MDTNVEKINEFQSFDEFCRFEKWIENEVSVGYAVEVDVKDYYAGVNFRERWFEFKKTGSVWRLVYPDGPFRGYWDEVPS